MITYTFSDIFWHFLFPQRCLLCNTLIEYSEELCTTCIRTAPYIEKEDNKADLYSLFWYNESTYPMIYKFKYNGYPYMGKQMARFLYKKQALPSKIIKNALFVPVPLHENRQKSRGFNQAAIIAKEISRLYNAPWANLLIRVKDTHAQRELSSIERKENVKDAFICKDSPYFSKIKQLILVDDIYTTGATLEACKAAILNKNSETIVHYATILKAKNPNNL